MNFDFNHLSDRFVFWNLKKITQGYLELVDSKGKKYFFGNNKSSLKAKVKIVHSCGFDSIPSDLGCLFLQNHAIQSNGKPCNQVKLFVEKIKGGVSGGTVASMIAIIKRVKDKKIKKLLFNPFALYPECTSPGPKQPWQKKTQWVKEMNCWTSRWIWP